MIHLLWLSLLMLLSGQESRNQYNENLLTQETKIHLEKLFGLQLPDLPHGDSLAHLWKKLNPSALEKLRTTMVRHLIRQRCLEKFRFKGHYLMAIDGVEVHRWKERHCENCLYGKVGKSKEKQYYHRVLEVKLVSPCGLSLSVASEFIENIDADPNNKQDCELKAFYRLAPRLKAMFPQLKIALLADGLYPNGPVFEICRRFDWKYILVLQNDCLISVWEDFDGLMDMGDYAIGAKIHRPIVFKDEKMYRWQNDLAYEGKDFEGSLNLMDVSVLNTETDEYQRRRAFLTNFQLSQDNMASMEHIGQQRWKIENQGFDMQKHHGYALEHVYCRNPNAMKVVYHLIQIAHLLNQLILKADLLDIWQEIRSFKTYFKTFTQALNQLWTPDLDALWGCLRAQRVQIRWKEE